MLSEFVAFAESVTSSPMSNLLNYSRGVLSSQDVLATSSLICVFVGIGLCYVVPLPKTPVSAGIMVASLGATQHQGHG